MELTVVLQYELLSVLCKCQCIALGEKWVIHLQIIQMFCIIIVPERCILQERVLIPWLHAGRQRGGGEDGGGMKNALCEVVFGVPVMKCYKFSMCEGGGGARFFVEEGAADDVGGVHCT